MEKIDRIIMADACYNNNIAFIYMEQKSKGKRNIYQGNFFFPQDISYFFLIFQVFQDTWEPW